MFNSLPAILAQVRKNVVAATLVALNPSAAAAILAAQRRSTDAIPATLAQVRNDSRSPGIGLQPKPANTKKRRGSFIDSRRFLLNTGLEI